MRPKNKRDKQKKTNKLLLMNYRRMKFNRNRNKGELFKTNKK